MITRTLTTLALLAMTAPVAGSQETVRLAVGPESRLWIEGTTNVSRFTCTATDVDAKIEVELGFREAADFPRYLRSVQVTVPVTGLRCGNARMDADLRRALGADDATGVAYIMASFDALCGQKIEGYTVHTAGTLMLAGRENELEMDVSARHVEAGGIEAVGEVPIRMTDYGITPPRAMLGVVRARDRVVVKFDLTLSAATIASVTSLSEAVMR